LELCQRLYDTHKILSYPRTDGEYLTSDLKDEVKKRLDCINFAPFDTYANKARLSDIADRYYNDAKITDHHALIPVENSDTKNIYLKLSEDEKRVFNAVVLRFIALFYPAYIYETVKVISTKGENLFLSKGRSDISLGFMQLYKDEEREEKEESLPNLSEGDILEIVDINCIGDKTKAKKRYTTDSLLTLMKMYSIGTGATRAKIIKDLISPKGLNKDKYVEKKKTNFISTNLGRNVAGLIPDTLKSLDILSNFDKKLERIEAGELDKDRFLEELEKELAENLALMKKDETPKLASEKPKPTISKHICPICGKELIVHSSGLGCIGYKDKSCSFFLGKVGGKKIPEKEIVKLLSTGKSGTIKGFKSKAGKTFDSALVINNGKVMYEFLAK
ncbi:MAG: DNA topoisomerase, partial [Anaerovoracaceae bacterium]